MSVVLFCVGKGLCDELIITETPKREAKGPSWTISVCELMNIVLQCEQRNPEQKFS
jgi:hypothetical protein